MREHTIILPPNSNGHVNGNGNGNGNGDDHGYRVTVFAPKRRFLSYLRDRWWVVIICIVALVGAAFAYDTIRPETYDSYAQLYLSGDVQINVAGQFTEESRNYFGTQIELLKSSRLQQAASQRVNESRTAGLSRDPVDLIVVQPMGTSILRLRATGSDPRFTQAFLEALISEYMTYKKETRLSTVGDVVDSLNKELLREKKSLKELQDNYAEFARTNNVAVLEQESKSTGVYLAELNLQLSKLKLEHGLMENAFAALGKSQDVSSNELAATNASGLTNAAVVDTGKIAAEAIPNADSNSPAADTGSISKIVASEDAMLRKARIDLEDTKIAQQFARGGTARDYDDQIARLERKIHFLEGLSTAQKQSDIANLEKRIETIETNLPAQKANLRSTDERLSEAKRLAEGIQLEQRYYDHLLTMMQNVDLGKRMEQERLSVLEPASPAMPGRRNLALLILLATLGGTGLSLGIIFPWYLADDRFVSFRDVKEQFGEMVLGLIPRVRVRRRQAQQALLQPNDSRYAYVEAFRHLRSALLFSTAAEGGAQTLLVTSAAEGEGKSTVAANLAITLARSGLRVALVDADSRGGHLHHLFDQPETPGMRESLRGEAEVASIVRTTTISNLNLVSCGAGPMPDGLFLRPELKELIKALRADRDFIILDGPPVLDADDVASLTALSDLVMLVVRPFQTKSRLLRHAMDMLYQRQAKRMAIVFNQARSEDLAGQFSSSRSNNRSNGANKPTGGRKIRANDLVSS